MAERVLADTGPIRRPMPRVQYRLALGFILVLAGVLRFWGLGRYPGLIYDEYYYVPAADTLLSRPSPVLIKHAVPGIDPNLLSHPPLAKELIAAAIWLFGNHPWVWRLPGALLGTLVPLVVAGLAWDLFSSRAVSLMAGLLAACDGLLIPMARVALPDSTAVPLVLGGLWLFWRNSQTLRETGQSSIGRWLLTGWVLGLALAAEWIGGQALVLAWGWMFLHWRKTRRAFWQWAPALTVVPLAIYFVSYFYAWPHGFEQSWLPRNVFLAFGRLQWLMLKDMWTLKFFHPWTSNAWSWLGLPRPTALILSLTAHESVRLWALPDPVVVWFGLAAIVGGLIRGRRISSRKAWQFLGLWMLAFYGTWLLTPRSKFVYYFTTAGVGLDLAVAAGLAALWAAGRWPRRIAVLGGGITVLSLFYLLPLWVGMALPRPWYHRIDWPNSWNPRVRATRVIPTTSYPLTYHPPRKPVAAWDVPGSWTPRVWPWVPTPWTVFEGTPTHNPVYRTNLASAGGYRLDLGGPIVDPVTVSGSMLYVGTNGNQLWAINWQTGQVVWVVVVPNMAMTNPLVKDGLVVIGLGNNAFRAYNTTEGWVRGTGINGLMAFQADTGHEVWFYPTVGETMATPVWQGNTLYDVTGGGHFIAVDARTGRLLWRLTLGGFDSMSSLVASGPDVYVAINRYLHAYPATWSKVVAVDTVTHQVAWATSLPVASGLSDSSLAAAGGSLFVAGVPAISDNGQGGILSNALFGLNQATGRVLWQVPLGAGHLPLDQEEEGIPLVMGNTVYEGSPTSHSVFAVNTKTGQVLWRTRLPSGVTANPLGLAPGLIWVTQMNGRIAYMNAANGHLLGQSPALGPVGPESPVLVGHTLIEGTLSGQLWVIPVSPRNG
ncbi:MAG: PQQ-binding-like beta-propeller repeat protein [Sulfobacillus sp.]|nr:PQQ-binding-like beta-propeller repeat protein [Sulfobacillus sp.]